MSTRRKAVAKIELATRFVAATGSPISDEDAAVIGTVLARIAESNRVDEVRSLDKHLVFDEVEADPRHPLRRFYNWDDKTAARQQRLHWTGTLIRSVRVISPSLSPRQKPVPQFLHAPHGARRSSADGPVQRSHALTEDVVASDPLFVSTVAAQVKLVRQAVDRLDHIAGLRKSRREMSLVRAIREALDGYLSVDAAAE